MQELVDKQRRAMKRMEARLAAQQEDALKAREAEKTRMQTLLEEQRQRQEEILERRLTEAQEREEQRLSMYRTELEALALRVPDAPPDPLQEYQETALAHLRTEQGRVISGDPYLRDVDEPDQEPDTWGLEPSPGENMGDPPPQEDPPLPDMEPLEPMEPPYGEPTPYEELPVPSPGPDLPSRPSPPEDTPSFVGLIQRAAAHFHLPLEKSTPSSSYLLAKLGEPVRTISALPIEPLLWETGLDLMRTPATTPALNPRADRKYRMPPTAPLCLRGQPSAASIIASSAKSPAATQVADHLLSPPSKASKRWDTMGKRVIASSALQARAANYGAVLSRYDQDMWDKMGEVMADLPPDKQAAAASILAEGRQISNSLLRVSLDASDSAYRQMNHGVWMRRQGWLADCAFGQELHPKILNLPFDGAHVFGPEVDALLLHEKTRKETMKAMTPITRGRAGAQTSSASTSRFGGRNRGGRGNFPSHFPQPQFTPTPSPYGTHGQYPFLPYQQPQRGSYPPRQGGRPRRGANRGQRPPKTV